LLNRLDVPHLLLDLVADLLPFFELVPLTLLLLFFIQSDLLAQLIGVLLDEGLPFSLEFYFNVPFLLLNLYDALELVSVLLGLFLLPNLLLVLLLLAGVHQFLVNFALGFSETRIKLPYIRPPFAPSLGHSSRFARQLFSLAADRAQPAYPALSPAFLSSSAIPSPFPLLFVCKSLNC